MYHVQCTDRTGQEKRGGNERREGKRTGEADEYSQTNILTVFYNLG